MRIWESRTTESCEDAHGHGNRPVNQRGEVQEFHRTAKMDTVRQSLKVGATRYPDRSAGCHQARIDVSQGRKIHEFQGSTYEPFRSGGQFWIQLDLEIPLHMNLAADGFEGVAMPDGHVIAYGQVRIEFLEGFPLQAQSSSDISLPMEGSERRKIDFQMARNLQIEIKVSKVNEAFKNHGFTFDLGGNAADSRAVADLHVA